MVIITFKAKQELVDAIDDLLKTINSNNPNPIKRSELLRTIIARALEKPSAIQRDVTAMRVSDALQKLNLPNTDEVKQVINQAISYAPENT